MRRGRREGGREGGTEKEREQSIGAAVDAAVRTDADGRRRSSSDCGAASIAFKATPRIESQISYIDFVSGVTDSVSLRKYVSFLSLSLSLPPSLSHPHPSFSGGHDTREETKVPTGGKAICCRCGSRHAARPCLSLASISMFPLFYICVMFESSLPPRVRRRRCIMQQEADHEHDMQNARGKRWKKSCT